MRQYLERDDTRKKGSEPTLKINFALWSTGLEGGGGVRAIFEIVNGLLGRGHQVSISALGGNDKWFPLKTKVNYVELPHSMKISAAIFALKYRRSITWLESNSLVERIANKSHLDLVRTLSEAIPSTDANVATWFPTALAVWLSGEGKQFYFMQDFHEQEMPSAYDRKVFQTTLRLPMYFLTNSEFTKEVVLEVQPNAKVKVVGAGVNLEVFYPRKKRVIDSHGVPIVAVIVRKEPIKQASLAIEVLNQVNKVVPIHAILIGKIPQNVRIDFHFSSYTRITDNELAELYSASDLFLFTSSVEGFALPPLEAMACGTPVVTTDCKGNRDYATDGFNCLISPQKDKEQLVSQTVNVLKKEKLREHLIVGGLETAKRFTWNSVVDRFEVALKENV